MKIKNLVDFRPKFFDTMRNYSREKFVSDLTSGVIVGIVAIPLAIAFGIASVGEETGATAGLVTAIFGGLLISMFGGSKVQIGGPTGAFIGIIVGVVNNPDLGLGGLAIATVMAGIMLVIMGLCRMGSIIKYMPYPIIIGFTGGIAIIIFSSQIVNLLGMNIVENIPDNFVGQWACYLRNIPNASPWSAVMGVVSIAIIALTPKISKKIPGSLLAIVIMTVAAYFLNKYAGAGIRTIGAMPPIGEIFDFGLELPEGSIFDTIQKLAPVAFTIAMLGAIESLLSAMVADGVIGDRHNSNTELVGQGLANIFVPFIGGIPATGAIARTMTNINNGGKTPIAGIIHAMVLLLVLLFLGDVVALIPLPCLAGVLVMVAYNMSGWRTILSMCKSSMSGTGVLFVTLLLTVFFDLTLAIMVGLVMAIALFMRRAMQSAHISVMRDEVEVHRDGEKDEVLTIPSGAEVFEIEGPFFFGIANKFDELTRNTDARQIRIIRMRKVTFIDATGLHNLEIFLNASRKEGRVVILSGVHDNVEKALRRAGIVKLVGNENVCDDIHKALQRAKEVSEQLSLK